MREVRLSFSLEHLEAIVGILIGIISILLRLGNREAQGEEERKGNSWSVEESVHTIFIR